jgi:hypothetical protein
MLPLTRQYLTPGNNPSGTVVAVEFYNRSLQHYFMSTNPDEIDGLDTGVFVGWERTGFRFLAYSTPVPGTNPVCRFYRAPAYGDSHFYSASPAECTATAQEHPVDWIYESPNGLLHSAARHEYRGVSGEHVAHLALFQSAHHQPSVHDRRHAARRDEVGPVHLGSRGLRPRRAHHVHAGWQLKGAPGSFQKRYATATGASTASDRPAPATTIAFIPNVTPASAWLRR